MFKRLVVLFILIGSVANGQHTVKGELQPAENYPWMLLYQLKGAKQNYVAYDSIKNSTFSIAIPKGKTPGIYRLVYDLKNRLFVDFIYADEDVALTFDPKKPNESVQFSVSEQNKIYRNYIKETQPVQQRLDSLQVLCFKASDTKEQENIANAYQKSHKTLTLLQQQFEAQSNGKITNHFIKASARYNAENPVKISADYLSSVKDHFFDNIDLNNEVLLNSTFINDKINDFIFYLNTSDDKKVHTKLYKEAIATVMAKISTNYNLAKDIEEGLLYTFAQQENISMVNTVLNYYLQLPTELQDRAFISDIKGQLKTAIGTIAPNILWTENNNPQSLHMLDGASYYVVAFWSSTCGHCLIEMPVLYDFLKGNTKVKVIAVGLEEEASKAGWETQITSYPNFINVYGENKWENKFAHGYGVNATPTFFVLDAQKKVIAKPDDVAELKLFFEEQ